jgi:SAM-dependent methyltransferase
MRECQTSVCGPAPGPGETYDPAAYGDGCAAFYDQLYPVLERSQLATLRALAGTGPVLELGVGTGRAAVPLAAAGLDVYGIDASAAMLERLQVRAQAARVHVIQGDFASANCGGPFSLIYALVSTLALLPSVAWQRRCLGNVAAHLSAGGLFVNETSATSTSIGLVTHEHLLPLANGPHSYRVTTLCLPLAQVDALAREAGLVLVARWGDWRRTPWEPGARHEISVYRCERRAPASSPPREADAARGMPRAEHCLGLREAPHGPPRSLAAGTMLTRPSACRPTVPEAGFG